MSRARVGLTGLFIAALIVGALGADRASGLTYAWTASGPHLEHPSYGTESVSFLKTEVNYGTGWYSCPSGNPPKCVITMNPFTITTWASSGNTMDGFGAKYRSEFTICGQAQTFLQTYTYASGAVSHAFTMAGYTCTIPVGHDAWITGGACSDSGNCGVIPGYLERGPHMIIRLPSGGAFSASSVHY